MKLVAMGSKKEQCAGCLWVAASPFQHHTSVQAWRREAIPAHPCHPYTSSAEASDALMMRQVQC